MKKKSLIEKLSNFNLKIFISLIILISVAISSVLFVFENNHYYNKNIEIGKQIRNEINNQIRMVKNLSNYLFWDSDFQSDIKHINDVEAQAYIKHIYAHLSSSAILASMVRDIWYLAFDEDKEISFERLLMMDNTISYAYQNLDGIRDILNSTDYSKGGYFYLPLKYNGRVLRNYIAIGQVVLSSLLENYYEPIGIGVLVINVQELTKSFVTMKMTQDVEIVLLDGLGNSYSSVMSNYSDDILENNDITKIKFSLENFDFNIVIFYSNSMSFINFLPVLLSVAGISAIIVILLTFYIKRRNYALSHSYKQFISTFEQIAEGDLKKKLEPFGDPEIDNVARHFNRMMDSVIDLGEKLRIEEAKLTKSRLEKRDYILKYLNIQINNHFLFNVFNLIRAHINLKKYKESVDCIDYLSTMLRYALNTEDLVRLGEEINSLNSYLNIQKMRFKDFTVSIEIDEGLHDIVIPKFILQPIIENSFTHGYKKGKFTVAIRADFEGDVLTIYIIDNGSGMTKAELENLRKKLRLSDEYQFGSGNGIGLINVQYRLRMLSDPRNCILIDSVEDEHTTVQIKICGVKHAESVHSR